ncbi:MAG: class I SAM-dependent methyltransferase [Patescibacteria group bacterium]
MMNSQNVYSKIGNFTRLYDFLSSLVGYKDSVKYFVSQLPFSEDEYLNVLDAGCGTGVYSTTVLKRFKNAKVVAFDLNPKLTNFFKARLVQHNYEHRIDVFLADITKELTELQDKKFDLIIAAGVLEHVPIEETVRNLSRFLVKEGWFFNSPVKDSNWGRFICKLYACKPYGNRNVTAFEQNGFKLYKVIDVPRSPAASFKEAYIFQKLN